VSEALLVFTDLDGSLLDHHSYSYAAAVPALEQLARRSIPVVPVSSKTRSEIAHLRQSLGNEHPYIVENGAAVLIPVNYFAQQPAGTVVRDECWVKEFSAPRSRWLELLESLQQTYPGEFTSFFRAGVEGITSMTGLSPAAAELANNRQYSEPVQWLGDEQRKARFVAELESSGAHALQGGRFLTVAGSCDKGRALAWLRAAYQQALDVEKVRDLAIGDSGNDVAMLEAAETALVIRSPASEFPKLNRTQGVIYSRSFGPEGWAEGVEQWLTQLTGSANISIT
jgi:mannosyl-3-phosphoglycerate phosphatase